MNLKVYKFEINFLFLQITMLFHYPLERLFFAFHNDYLFSCGWASKTTTGLVEEKRYISDMQPRWFDLHKSGNVPRFSKGQYTTSSLISSLAISGPSRFGSGFLIGLLLQMVTAETERNPHSTTMQNKKQWLNFSQCCMSKCVLPKLQLYVASYYWPTQLDVQV